MIAVGYIYLTVSLILQNLDSVRANNGSFTFTGKADSPQFCLLGIPNNGQKEFRRGLFVENGHINISGKRDSIEQALITGSPTQGEYNNFLASRKFLDDEENNLDKVYGTLQAKGDKKGMDSVEKFFELIEKKRKTLQRNMQKIILHLIYLLLKFTGIFLITRMPLN